MAGEVWYGLTFLPVSDGFHVNWRLQCTFLLRSVTHFWCVNSKLQQTEFEMKQQR